MRIITLHGYYTLTIICAILVFTCSCEKDDKDEPTGISWQKSFGGSEYDEAASIQQTTDGGYIIAGATDSNDGDVNENKGDFDCWIVKLTSTGEFEWQKSLGGSGYEHASSIQQTTDGGYIVAGESHSDDGDVAGNHRYRDCWIVKLTSIE